MAAHVQIRGEHRGWSASREAVRDDINRRRLEPLTAMDAVCFLSKTIVCAAFMMQAAQFSEYNYVHFC